MSEWFFLWEECKTDQERMDAMSCGMTAADFAYLDEQEREKRDSALFEIRELRSCKQISREEFLRRKKEVLSKMDL